MGWCSSLLCVDEKMLSFPPPARKGMFARETLAGVLLIESYAKNRHANACRFSGDPAGIRTPDPLLKRQLLCRLSYRVIADGRAH